MPLAAAPGEPWPQREQQRVLSQLWRAALAAEALLSALGSILAALHLPPQCCLLGPCSNHTDWGDSPARLGIEGNLGFPSVWEVHGFCSRPCPCPWAGPDIHPHMWPQSSAVQAPLRTECIQGWGNILLAQFPQQTSVTHSPVAVWL